MWEPTALPHARGAQATGAILGNEISVILNPKTSSVSTLVYRVENGALNTRFCNTKIAGLKPAVATLFRLSLEGEFVFT